MSSKAFLFVCLSLCILSIIISSHAAFIPDIPEEGNEAREAAKEAGKTVLDASKEVADQVTKNMAKENTVTIALAVVSVVTSLTFTNIFTS